MFADLSGFTHLSEGMDPEDVRTLVHRCMGAMATIVEGFGGSVRNVIGDALLAVFGAPTSHEDDAERAVRAALELQRYARESSEELGGLSLRVGIKTGEVMYAPVGPDHTFTVMGDVVNTAARLQTSAPSGGILVGEQTYRATREAIRYDAPRQFHVKGKDVPIWAARVVEPLAAPGTRVLSASPMVGRDAEFALLESTWERVVAEKVPHLVTILGPPGIGKSRLGREFASLVIRGGGRVLEGRSLPYGESTGYGAFGHQLKRLAGILETDAAPAAREKLVRKVAGLLPVEMAGDVAPQVALLMGLGAEAAVADRGALFLSARRLVEALAREQPLALVFEDIHWSDPSLLDLMEFLAGRVRDAPVLLVALARPELLDRRPTWGATLTSSIRLELQPLPAENAGRLVRWLLPGIRERAIMDRLVDTAGGNPLFVEELASSFVERATDMAGTLPTNVKAIIAARLDTLPAPERRLLLNAAVVGRIFWKGALHTAAGNGETPALLDALEARGLIRREPSSTFAGDEEFSFKHILIREVAHATLPRAERRKRHAEVATFLERHARDRLAESASLLAHHWREAGEDERALDYLLAAAEHASRAWAKGEAVMLFTEALELIPDADRTRRSTVSLKRAIATLESSQFGKAVAAFDAVLPDLRGRERVEALVGQARAYIWLNDPDGATSSSAEATKAAATLGDEVLQAGAQAVASLAMGLRGFQAEFVAIGDSLLRAWRGGRTEQAVYAAFVGLGHYWLGHYERALEGSRVGYELGMEVHGVEAALAGGACLGLALAGLGRHEEALEVHERVAAHGREIELVPRFTARAINMWAGTLREVMDLKRARELNEEAVELARSAAFAQADIQGRIDLLFLDLAEGDVGSAEKACPRLWEEALATKGVHQWLMAGRVATARAEIALAHGKGESATEAAREAIDMAERYGRLKYEVASRLVLGSALLGRGRATEAVAELRQALQRAEGLGHPPSRWRAADKLALALAATGDDEGAASLAAKAKEIIEAFADSLSEHRRRAYLATPQVVEAVAR